VIELPPRAGFAAVQEHLSNRRSDADVDAYVVARGTGLALEEGQRVFVVAETAHAGQLRVEVRPFVCGVDAEEVVA